MFTKILIVAGLLQLAIAAPQVTPSRTTGRPTAVTTRSATSTCPIICIDYVNACGQGYGGCVPHCPGQTLPTFTPPPCTKTTTKTTTSPKPTTTTTTTTKATTTFTKTTTSACPTLCIDYINSCGGMWGTCIPRCPGTPMPTFTPPPCSTRTTLATWTTPPRVTTDYVTYTRST